MSQKKIAARIPHDDLFGFVISGWALRAGVTAEFKSARPEAAFDGQLLVRVGRLVSVRRGFLLHGRTFLFGESSVSESDANAYAALAGGFFIASSYENAIQQRNPSTGRKFFFL